MATLTPAPPHGSSSRPSVLRTWFCPSGSTGGSSGGGGGSPSPPPPPLPPPPFPFFAAESTTLSIDTLVTVGCSANTRRSSLAISAVTASMTANRSPTRPPLALVAATRSSTSPDAVRTITRSCRAESAVAARYSAKSSLSSVCHAAVCRSASGRWLSNAANPAAITATVMAASSPTPRRPRLACEARARCGLCAVCLSLFMCPPPAESRSLGIRSPPGRHTPLEVILFI